MTDKLKNKFLIQDEYDMDLLFVENKIDYDELAKIHKPGDKEIWDEIPYVAQHPFFLHSLLMELVSEHRLRAFMKLNQLSFDDIKKLGFGGSISNFFTYDSKRINDIFFTKQAARLALILDIPIVFLLKDQPSHEDRIKYDFMEYRELGEKTSLQKLSNSIKRPKRRAITPYILEKVPSEIQLSNFIRGNIFCRLDLHKTFFIVELHPRSVLDIDIMTIRKVVEIFDNKITHVISFVPYLRDSTKLCFIGTYIEEQYQDANKYSENLIKFKNGIKLWPYNFTLF